MFEKDYSREKILTEMQKTVLMDSESHLKSVVRTRPKSLNKFMIIAMLSKGLINYQTTWWSLNLANEFDWKYSYNLNNNGNNSDNNKFSVSQNI